MKPLRARQKLGKYVIERRLGEGGFAVVYQARDTIEGIRVALKIPHPHMLTPGVMEDFRREVRLSAQLEHPNILPLRNAQFVEGHFVIASRMGEMTLDERLTKRLSLDTALDFARQMLAAVAFAHENKIVHCDIKPDNFILFEGNRLRLTDFGVAMVAERTLRGSGSGTLGYMAPDQAMGRPSFRSDVFSLGLVLYRMFAGRLPEYPFTWPPPGYRMLQRKVSPGFIAVIRKAIEVDPKMRYSDGGAMLAAYDRLKTRRRGRAGGVRRQRRTTRRTNDWKAVLWKQFNQEFGRALDARFQCAACQGPVAEAMIACPWCGVGRHLHEGGTTFPQECPRCQRGMKLDWPYCPWCFGPGFEVLANREYSDKRYASGAKCRNANCTRKVLMPFMRYCPWCRTKVRRKWKIPESKETCPHCKWGAADGFWSYCPWCGKQHGGG